MGGETLPWGGSNPLLAAGDQGPEGLRLQLVLPDPPVLAQQLQLPQIQHVQVRPSPRGPVVAHGVPNWCPVTQRDWSRDPHPQGLACRALFSSSPLLPLPSPLPSPPGAPPQQCQQCQGWPPVARGGSDVLALLHLSLPQPGPAGQRGHAALQRLLARLRLHLAAGGRLLQAALPDALGHHQPGTGRGGGGGEGEMELPSLGFPICQMGAVPWCTRGR